MNVKHYDWDTDGRGHMWSYEKADGPWVGASAHEAAIAALEARNEALREALRSLYIVDPQARERIRVALATDERIA